MSAAGQDISRLTSIKRRTVCAVLAGALAGLSAIFSGVQLNHSGFLLVTSAQAQTSDQSERSALLTVRDASGIKGEAIPLSIGVQARYPGGASLTVRVGEVPLGALLTDGSRSEVAQKDGDIIDITDWDLPRTTITMPPGIEGRRRLLVVAAIEKAGRPLQTEISFAVNVSADRASLPSTNVRTVEAEVKADQVTVRANHDIDPSQAGTTNTGASGPTQGEQETTASGEVETTATNVPVREALSPSQSVTRDPVTEALASERKSWLEREQARTDELTRQLVAAHEQIGELRSQVSSPALGQSTRGESRATPELKEVDLTRLLERANELIQPGDISGARLLLERALETGSREAAFYLAQTYDPRVLQSWNVQGIRPDIERAQALYNRAFEAGLAKAKEMADLMR